MAIYRHNKASTRHTIVAIMCGRRGETGLNGTMSAPDVVAVINTHLHTAPSTDALTYTPDGRLRVTVESLNELPTQ